MGIKGELLDVKKLFTDEEYKQQIIDRYDKVKLCINIFEIID
jgi:hypothetical protein